MAKANVGDVGYLGQDFRPIREFSGEFETFKGEYLEK